MIDKEWRSRRGTMRRMRSQREDNRGFSDVIDSEIGWKSIGQRGCFVERFDNAAQAL